MPSAAKLFQQAAELGGAVGRRRHPDLAAGLLKCRSARGGRLRGDGDEHRRFFGCLYELARECQPGLGIEHDSHEGARAGGPRREERVVGEYGADADEDRVDAAAEVVHDPTRCSGRQPAVFLRSRGQGAIEAHRPLGDHPRAAPLHERAKGGGEPRCLPLQQANLDRQAGSLERRDATPRHRRKGIAGGDHHAADAGRDHGVGAGGRLAVMAAGLERDKQRRSAAASPRSLERHDLGMRSAEGRMPAFADDPLVAGRIASRHHRADHRIGLNAALSATGQFQGARHRGSIMEIIHRPEPHSRTV
jgi:hypothetical protein